jgi:hypothetical protein
VAFRAVTAGRAGRRVSPAKNCSPLNLHVRDSSATPARAVKAADKPATARAASRPAIREHVMPGRRLKCLASLSIFHENG